MCVFFPGMFTYVYMSFFSRKLPPLRERTFFLDQRPLPFAGLPCGFVGEAGGL